MGFPHENMCNPRTEMLAWSTVMATTPTKAETVLLDLENIILIDEIKNVTQTNCGIKKFCNELDKLKEVISGVNL